MASTVDSVVVFDVAVGWRDSGGTVTTEYFSTVPRAGDSTDVTYAGPISGRVTQIAIEEFLFGKARTRGPRQVGAGAIVLENGDGGLDAWAGRSVHLCPVTIRRVNLASPSTGVTEFEGFAEQVVATDRDVTIYVRDKTWIFDKPALQTQYLGSNVAPNGVEGTAEMKGMRKPWLLGTANRIPLVCVNTSKLVYQADGVDGFTMKGTPPFTIYDAGVALTWSGVIHANQAAMEAAAAPAAGTYDRWYTGGCVMLGSTPTGQITGWLANYTAAAASSPAAGVTPTPTIPPTLGSGSEFHDFMASVARKLDVTINVTASTDLIAASSAGAMTPAMVYLTGEETYLDLLNMLAGSAGAAWKFSGSTITCTRLADPSAATATISYAEADFAAQGQGSSLKKIASGDDDRGIPAWRVIVQYAENRAVEVGTQLAGAVSASDRLYRAMQWWTSEASDTSVKTQWPNAPEITVQSTIGHQNWAQDEADRLLALYSVRRDFFEAEIQIARVGESFPVLGTIVNVTHSRFGLTGGKNFAVIGRKFNVERGTCTLTLWG